MAKQKKKKGQTSSSPNAASQRAKVQVMSSWTRTSPGVVGSMGGGIAFIEGGGGATGHIPVPNGVTSHTHALLLAMSEIMDQFPATVELEFEVTHRMLVLTFNRFGSTAADVASAMAFIRRVLTSGGTQVVTGPVLDAFASRLLARQANTFFSMCVDKGRYLTYEMSLQRPPGEVAAKRVEALEQGAFFIFRATGNGNDDLLEVRWAGLFESSGSVFQERFRDTTPDEVWALHAWSTALSNELGEEGESDGHGAPFSPLRLANEDPGIFWSCVRHDVMKGWPRALILGRAESWGMRDKLWKELSCDCEFPGEQRGEVAVRALLEVQRRIDRLPGFKKGLGISILNDADEKDRILAGDQGEYEKFVQMMEAMKGLPSHKRDEMLAQLQLEEEKRQTKEAQRQKRREESGKPDMSCKLIGQSLCCWSCGNCEAAQRSLSQCPLCAGHLCGTAACMLTHRRYCFSAEPEEEDALYYGGAVDCVVLPADERIKPYRRVLPRKAPAAAKMLAEVLRCETLMAVTPQRAFRRGFADPSQDGSRICQRGLFLLQANWADSLRGKGVEITGLTSKSGRQLNGHSGTLGSYHEARDRWEVTCGPGQAKLLKSYNLVASGSALPELAPQNLRASAISTSLFENSTFGDDEFSRMSGGIDNRFVCGAHEIGVRARGDVWAVRVDVDEFESATELLPFTFAEFESLWGIFNYMPIPGQRYATGTVMAKNPDSEEMLGSALRSAFFADAEDLSDDEVDEQSAGDIWDWMLAEAEEEPEPLVGALIEVFGLKTAQQYNGARGRILDVGERVEVKLFSPHDKTLRVKQSNIAVIRERGQASLAAERCGSAAELAPPGRSGVEGLEGAEEKLAPEPQAEPEDGPGLLDGGEERGGVQGEEAGGLQTDIGTLGASDPSMNPQSENSSLGHGGPPRASETAAVPELSERPVGSQFFCEPRELRFSQDTVSRRFRSGISIRETLDQLLSRSIRKRDVEMMRVVLHEGHLYTLSNRRLALYRLLQMAGRCRRVKVELVEQGPDFWRKLTTRCWGEKVVIRDTLETVGRDRESTSFQHGLLER